MKQSSKNSQDHKTTYKIIESKEEVNIPTNSQSVKQGYITDYMRLTETEKLLLNKKATPFQGSIDFRLLAKRQQLDKDFENCIRKSNEILSNQEDFDSKRRIVEFRKEGVKSCDKGLLSGRLTSHLSLSQNNSKSSSNTLPTNNIIYVKNIRNYGLCDINENEEENGNYFRVINDGRKQESIEKYCSKRSEEELNTTNYLTKRREAELTSLNVTSTTFTKDFESYLENHNIRLLWNVPIQTEETKELKEPLFWKKTLDFLFLKNKKKPFVPNHDISVKLVLHMFKQAMKNIGLIEQREEMLCYFYDIINNNFTYDEIEQCLALERENNLYDLLKDIKGNVEEKYERVKIKPYFDLNKHYLLCYNYNKHQSETKDVQTDSHNTQTINEVKETEKISKEKSTLTYSKKKDINDGNLCALCKQNINYIENVSKTMKTDKDIQAFESKEKSGRKSEEKDKRKLEEKEREKKEEEEVNIKRERSPSPSEKPSQKNKKTKRNKRSKSKAGRRSKSKEKEEEILNQVEELEEARNEVLEQEEIMEEIRSEMRSKSRKKSVKKEKSEEKEETKGKEEELNKKTESSKEKSSRTKKRNKKQKGKKTIKKEEEYKDKTEENKENLAENEEKSSVKKESEEKPRTKPRKKSTKKTKKIIVSDSEDEGKIDAEIREIVSESEDEREDKEKRKKEKNKRKKKRSKTPNKRKKGN